MQKLRYPKLPRSYVPIHQGESRDIPPKRKEPRMNIYLIEIWNGDYWTPIPETASLDESLVRNRVRLRREAHPHIRYRVTKWSRVGKEW